MKNTVLAQDIRLSLRMDSLLNLYGLKDEDCNLEITKCHLQEISSSLLEDWRSLPAHLEMEEIVVRDIDRKPVDESEKRHSFLSKWKSEKGSGATYKKLMASLLAIKCRGDAEKVCKLVQKLEAHAKQDSSLVDSKVKEHTQGKLLYQPVKVLCQEL